MAGSDRKPSSRATQITYLAAVDAVRGDQVALFGLLRRIRPRLVGYFQRHMGTRLRGTAEAEDLAQDALFEICQRLPAFQPQGHREFRAWLRLILHHRITHAARGKQQIPAGREPIDSSVPARIDTPSAVAMGRELRARVAVAMRAMPPAQAEVLALHLDEGLEPEQIAPRLGITAGNARVRLHRAREALHAWFERNGAGA